MAVTHPYLEPDALERTYELSKDDRAVFVGSDIRLLIGEIQRLRKEVDRCNLSNRAEA